MIYALAADFVVALHFAFVVLVAIGGFLALIWRWVAFVHIPAAIWGAYISLFGGVCPLTPLEQHFRLAAGQHGYDGGFIDHYLLAIIYPAGLDRTMQTGIGVLVVGINLALYAVLVFRIIRTSRKNAA